MGLLDRWEVDAVSCCGCPKRSQCSGADCYYDYHPEPDRELAEDMNRLASVERR